MKLILLLLSFLALTVLPGCTESDGSDVTPPERPPENGAQFKKGEGISLTDQMARSIGLQTTEVTEQKIAAKLPLTLRPLAGGTEASGWLPTGQAERVPLGASVEFAGDGTTTGAVKSIEKPAHTGLVDTEVIVALDKPLNEATEVNASIQLPEAEATASIPRSALLKTAEGYFVYAKNGNYFFRMGVTVGAMNDNHVEITEGLFSGDEVVTTPVMSLWMAELQVLRGGKACNCGH